MLLIDEATSGMDSVADANCTSFVLALCRRLSVALLIVTHKLTSTTPYVDNVLVIEHGRVAASGLHTHLLACANESVYSELWTTQMKTVTNLTVTPQ